MATDDVEFVRTAFAGRLEETAAAHWDADLEYVEDPRFPGASSHRGRDAVVARFQEYMELLGSEDELTITVERVLDAGERQVPIVRFRGNASTSGIPFDHVWAYLVEVRNERIVYIRAFYDPDEALAAAGLDPEA